ncbi:hypothetical protein AB0N06_37500 [Streptomyces sp. NPDC051020]
MGVDVRTAARPDTEEEEKSSSTGNYLNYFTKVQTVLNQTGLKVY